MPKAERRAAFTITGFFNSLETVAFPRPEKKKHPPVMGDEIFKSLLDSD